MRSFDFVLSEYPTNIVALLGKVCLHFIALMLLLNISTFQARVLYAQRKYKDSLKLYQDVLRYKPDCKPDPRVGIGLCLWSLDFKSKAKAAWQRSLEVVRAGCVFRVLLPLDVWLAEPW